MNARDGVAINARQEAARSALVRRIESARRKQDVRGVDDVIAQEILSVCARTKRECRGATGRDILRPIGSNRVRASRGLNDLDNARCPSNRRGAGVCKRARARRMDQRDLVIVLRAVRREGRCGNRQRLDGIALLLIPYDRYSSAGRHLPIRAIRND